MLPAAYAVGRSRCKKLHECDRERANRNKSPNIFHFPMWIGAGCLVTQEKVDEAPRGRPLVTHVLLATESLGPVREDKALTFTQPTVIA